MKILVITPRFPWPLTKGDKLRAYHQMRCLSKHHEILLFALSDELIPEEWVNELRPFCSVIRIHYLRKWKIALRFIYGFFSRRPFQCIYHYERKAAKELKKLVAKEKPDKLYFQLIRTAVYAEAYEPRKCIIDLMDCFSYHYLLRSWYSGIFLKYIYCIEFLRIKKYEGLILNKYPFVTIISEKDRSLLPANSNNVLIVPNGVVNEVNDEPVVIKFDLLFTGNLSYTPNIMAATFLCREIIPLLRSKYSHLTAIIAGASPGRKILSLADNTISVIPDVKDIEALRCRAKIFIAPMFLSTGMQNKILEAMASGIPVLTTPDVAQAIGAISGKHLFTALNANDFAVQTEQLLNMTYNDRNVLIQQARSFVRSNFNWEKNTSLLDGIINK